ncbi:hypothetical protein L6164_013124 [Bauhinia variegata]|uniref:Uncharacterized protein n=1 Tax=Bauhinia variegata TaxID=167791 RepID=A0ACB9PC45_BAUVA|nr:hypothetical protein L6164_013124 [Bauhinia variegata]
MWTIKWFWASYRFEPQLQYAYYTAYFRYSSLAATSEVWELFTSILAGSTRTSLALKVLLISFKLHFR